MHARPAGPTGPGEREPVLDVVRGFAILGILVVNIELMRGPVFYDLVTGAGSAPPTAADGAAQFAVGWLAANKFLSSLAILFGIGAALLATRSWGAGRSPRELLARRYGVLLALGIAHMVLLFPGDILFVYGLTGLVLLAFVGVRAGVALGWAGGLLAFSLAAGLAFASLGDAVPGMHPDDPAAAEMEAFFEGRLEQAVVARTEGSFADVVAVNVVEALFVQTGQLFIIPWVLALFLVGFAVGRSGVVDDLRVHRRRLAEVATVGLGIGLPLNLVIGFTGPLAAAESFQPGGEVTGPLLATIVALLVGAPLLAVGYLAALALLCLRWRPIRSLAAVGRMALSAYLIQSVLALVIFAGFRLYGALSTVQALLVVVGIWAVLLVVCPVWMRRFRFGPVEWLWRSATYGRRQPLRHPQPG